MGSSSIISDTHDKPSDISSSFFRNLLCTCRFSSRPIVADLITAAATAPPPLVLLLKSDPESKPRSITLDLSGDLGTPLVTPLTSEASKARRSSSSTGNNFAYICLAVGLAEGSWSQHLTIRSTRDLSQRLWSVSGLFAAITLSLMLVHHFSEGLAAIV